MKEECKADVERRQQVMTELYDKRQLALKKCCPYCWGDLKIRDICSLTCPACSLNFAVDELLKGASQ